MTADNTRQEARTPTQRHRCISTAADNASHTSLSQWPIDFNLRVPFTSKLLWRCRKVGNKLRNGAKMGNVGGKSQKFQCRSFRDQVCFVTCNMLISFVRTVQCSDSFTNTTQFDSWEESRSMVHNSTATNTKWYYLKKYVDEDSIIYDIIQGFFFAGLLCLAVVCCYNSCYYCCVRCGICPDDRVRRRRKKKGPTRPRAGHDDGKGLFAPLATNVGMDEESDEEDYLDTDNDGIGSCSDDSASLEYGGDQSLENEYGEVVDRFEEVQIENAAKRYFDKEEKASSIRESNTKKNRSKRRSKDEDTDYGESAIDDEEEEAPLDLEMIERQLVQNMEKSVFM